MNFRRNPAVALLMRLYDRLLPKPASRYPADPRAVFILGLCFVTGLPLLFRRVEPGSLQELLPGWVILLWSIGLVFGAGLTLVGMSRQTVDGIITEQVGSVMVGAASVVYSSSIYFVVGLDGAFAAAITAGWGLSCFWRWFQLQSLLAAGQRVVDNSRSGE